MHNVKQNMLACKIQIIIQKIIQNPILYKTSYTLHSKYICCRKFQTENLQQMRELLNTLKITKILPFDPCVSITTRLFLQAL